MILVFYIIMISSTLYMFYLASKPSYNFPYVYIVVSVINELLLTETDTFSGFPSIIRGLYLVSIFIFMIRFKIKTPLIFNVLFIYLGVFMFFVSTDTTFVRFFYKISYIFFVLSFFPMGSLLIKDEKFIPKLMFICKFLPLFALGYYTLIMFLGIEGKGYSDEFSGGAIQMARVNMLSYTGVILFVFMYAKYIPKNFTNVFSVVTALSLLVINAKRASLFIAFLGIIITLVYFKVSIQKIIGLSVISLLVIFVLSDVAGNIVSAQYEARSQRMTWQGIQQEGRYKEFEVLPKYFEDNFGSTKLLFGNGFGLDFDYRYIYLGVYGRAIHTDIVSLIWSIGLMGFLLYVIFWINLFGTLKKITKIINRSGEEIPKLLIPLGYSLFTMMVVLHFGGGVFSIGAASSLPFMVLGFLYGLSKQLEYSERLSKYENHESSQIHSPVPGLVYPRDPNSNV